LYLLLLIFSSSQLLGAATSFWRKRSECRYLFPINPTIFWQ
jgi:hypothetical protein